MSPTSPDGYLAPGENFANNTRRRSASVAPSFNSHITAVEENKDIDIPGLNNSRRRQTFRSPLKLSRWDWFKGLFNREALMRRIEDSMQLVSGDSPSPKVYSLLTLPDDY